jgi:Arc/MetJ-type ribon-helix-helix transcriptional regulator
VTQVAFQLSDHDLEMIDQMVPAEFRSRAEALRTAVRFWLENVEQRRIDAALAAGYQVLPPGEAEEQWAEISVEALGSSQLEW